ncbi:glycosyltransferase [Chloroflexales bacterium ZM16-3]|nr:glycosyltransferase [Chloroflexales bacterium ZM16-3]
MHIVLLSDHETRGGAAIAAGRLAAGLVSAGCRVTRLCAYPDGRPHPWASERLAAPLFPLRRMARRGLPLSARAALDELAVTSTDAALRRALARLRPDVVHLHNLHGGIGAGWSPRLLAAAAEHAPVAWTFHDMWAFTGRCAYSYGCEKFITGCDAQCPTPRQYPALPPCKIAGAWHLRRQIIAGAPRLVGVAPSRWMYGHATAGMWAARRVDHIPNGIDLDTYAPADPAAARRALGLPVSGPLVLVAMPHLADPRKGADLLSALATAPGPRPLRLITMGAGTLPASGAGVEILPLGYVAAEARRALAYSAADLLLHAAPQDNLPLTVIEAMACGTPTVAMPVGGLPELVRPGVTGWLADDHTPQALADTLATALADLAAGANLRGSCRAVAVAEYEISLFVARHLNLYQQL